MLDKYKIITLCGSAKFRKEFAIMQQKLTLKDNIVLLPTFFDDETEIADAEFQMLKDMHIKRIDIADEIFVINKNGYIGSDTKFEIEYALKTGKQVNYLEPILLDN